ncbi:MAG: hypothetical protein KAZ26_24600 [Caldilineaceae bacterium]|nr:hypothetical protein [Caldilineaceae bacterium]
MHIVNKYGVLHTVPDDMLKTIEQRGGRRATPKEIAAYEGKADAPEKGKADAPEKGKADAPEKGV